MRPIPTVLAATVLTLASPARAEETVPSNSLELSVPVLSVEYARRVGTGVWVGARAGLPLLLTVTESYGGRPFPGFQLGGEALVRVRTEDGPLTFGGMAAVGYGTRRTGDRELSHNGASLLVGADAGLYGVRLALELGIFPAGLGGESFWRLFLVPRLGYTFQF